MPASERDLVILQANKMVLADLPNLPGANVSKDDLPDGPKPLGKLDIGGGNSAGQVWVILCVQSRCLGSSL